jgi:hypothetical protein
MKEKLQYLEQLAEAYSKKIEEKSASEKEKIYEDIIE